MTAGPPRVIVRCWSTDDVAAAIRFAREATIATTTADAQTQRNRGPRGHPTARPAGKADRRETNGRGIWWRARAARRVDRPVEDAGADHRGPAGLAFVG